MTCRRCTELENQLRAKDKAHEQDVADFIAERERHLAEKYNGLAGVAQAITASCTCGGTEPGSCCPACEVWHRLQGRMP